MVLTVLCSFRDVLIKLARHIRYQATDTLVITVSLIVVVGCGQLRLSGLSMRLRPPCWLH